MTGCHYTARLTPQTRRTRGVEQGTLRKQWVVLRGSRGQQPAATRCLGNKQPSQRRALMYSRNGGIGIIGVIVIVVVILILVGVIKL